MDPRNGGSVGELETPLEGECQTPRHTSQNGNGNPHYSSAVGDSLEEAPEVRIERLGRQRPEVFKSLWAEIGFVFSISMSQVLTVSSFKKIDFLVHLTDPDSGKGILCFWLHSHTAHPGQHSRNTISLGDMARQRFFAHSGLLSSGVRSLVRHVWIVSSICGGFHLACFVEPDRWVFN